jgi:catechol 2,3-dioxygenase
MNQFRIADNMQLGQVRLQVSSLEGALAFYRDLLGFQEAWQENGTATLSATGRWPYHILLAERPGAGPKPPRTTGLYHVAIRYPSRRALTRAFGRLLVREWPFQGFADHLVSEALYLADPDGNGLELYVDRPREQWRQVNGQLEMATEPLDVEGLLAGAAGDTEPWTGVDPGTDIGHVHLHVSDLKRAEAFYSGLLGLDVTQRGYPGALFLSAGGYHHHLGLNIWAGAGAPPPPSDAVGLLSFSLQLPDGGAWRNLYQRVQECGLEVEHQRDDERARGILVRDPDGNGVELLVENTKMQTSNRGSR